MIRKYTLFIAFLSLVFLSSCDKDDNYQTRMEDERHERGDYLARNGSFELLPEGVYYQELYTPTDKNAKKVEAGDDVVVYFTGYFLNGLVFKTNMLSGKFEPRTIRLINEYAGQIINRGVTAGNVVSGWPPALLKMKEGTKARIVVPSNKAFNFYGTSNPMETNITIPGYTSLVYEIEVQEVRKPN